MTKFPIHEVVPHTLAVSNHNTLFEGYSLCPGVKKTNLMGEMSSGKTIV